MAGSSCPIEIFNRFTELEAARLAEEVVNKADQEHEEQEMLQWDQGRRNEVIATRKQQWHAAKRKLEAGQQEEGRRLVRSQSEGSGLVGNDRAATKRSRRHNGSSALLTVGPEAA
eukprot:4831093-Heterocapsa_arctica.AAC.2